MSTPDLAAITAALRPMVKRPRQVDPAIAVASAGQAAITGKDSAIGAKASSAPAVPKREPRARPDGSTVVDVDLVGPRVTITLRPSKKIAAKAADVLATAVALADGAPVDVLFRGKVAASTDAARVKPAPAPAAKVTTAKRPPAKKVS